MTGAELGLTYGLAFLAGVLSFLSPCVLPLAPSYLTFVTGMSVDELSEGNAPAARRQAVTHALLFVGGFALVFTLLGATATALGSAARGALPLIQQVGGVAIAIMGLVLLGVLRIPALARERRVHLARRPAGRIGTVLAGVAFGAGWTPCIGPVLASILLLAGMQPSVLEGTLLLAAYSVGLGVPFLLLALSFHWVLTRLRLVRGQVRTIERVAGALLVIVGLLLASGQFARLTAFLAGFGQLISIQ